MDNPESKEHLTQFYDAELGVEELLNEDRYIGHQLIDSGAIKEVFRVTDTHCAREVAFARIREEVFSLESAIDFIREVQTTSGFEHPNIIRIYGVGIKDGTPWFTMELSSGKTLENLLDETPELPLAERLEIFVQLCDAVSYAHERDVLHLDLKPANISIGKRGQVLLADWGLASSVCRLPEGDLVNAHTEQGMIKGSLGYMSPEQAEPGYRKDPASDVFGLGGILHFLLTNEPPIPGDDREEILTNTKNGVIKSLSRPEIPPRLVPLLGKVLSKDPVARYRSASELKSEIEAFRQGFATLAETASTWTKTKLFYRRNQAFCLIVLGVLGILITSTAYYISSIKASEERANLARRQAEEQKAEAELQRKEAQAQRAIAENNLKKFRVAEELRKRMNLEFADTLFIYANSQLMELDLDEALANAKKGVSRNPENPDAQKQLGNIHFMRQEFEDAVLHLKAGGKPESAELLKIAEEYQTKPHPLPVDDLAALFDRIWNPGRSMIRIAMFQYDSKIRPPSEHRFVVAHMVKKNAKLDSLDIKYAVKTKTLYLIGNPRLRSVLAEVKGLSTPFNLLSTLPIERLVLDDTPANRANIEKFKPNPGCTVMFR
ncbi:MAG: protein kinase [Luteolibacter sp.]